MKQNKDGEYGIIIILMGMKQNVKYEKYEIMINLMNYYYY